MFASNINLKCYNQSFKCLDISTENESQTTLKTFFVKLLEDALGDLFGGQLSGSNQILVFVGKRKVEQGLML